MSLALTVTILCYIALVAAYGFQKQRSRSRLVRILLKSLCSAGFLVIGILCGKEAGFENAPYWSAGILAALAFSALGDILLVLQKGEAGRKKIDYFTLGGVSFFAAHLIFSAVFIRWHGFIWPGILAALFLAGIQGILLKHCGREFGLLGTLSVVYCAALGFMAASGLSFFCLPVSENSLFPVCTALGAVLFLVSDLLLCSKLFLNKASFWVEFGNTVTYFGGQLMFAFTLRYVP